MKSTRKKKYFLFGLLLVSVLIAGIAFYSTPKYPVTATESVTSKDKVVPLNIDIERIDNTKPPEVEKPILEDDKIDIGSFPKNIDLTFSSGESVSVKYDLFGSYYLPPITSDNIENYVNSLLTLAEQGNGDAANALSVALNDCTNAPRNEQDFSSRMDALVTAGEYRTGNDGESIRKVDVGSYNFDSIVNTLKFDYHLCKNVSEDLLSQRLDWQEKAIELNSYEAITRRTGELLRVESSGRDRYELNKQAWEAGHVGVAKALGLAYEAGLPESTEGVPDRLTAFAYSLVQNKIIDGYLSESESPTASTLRESYRQAIAAESALLSPSEFLDVEQIAIELIRDNEKCCKGPWHFFDR